MADQPPVAEQAPSVSSDIARTLCGSKRSSTFSEAGHVVAVFSARLSATYPRVLPASFFARCCVER
jgi:hypothetical protein